MARFADRADAGRALGRVVRAHGVPNDTVVLALPRGGVPVGVEVAAVLGAPLDVLVVRKLRTPGQPELAFGAVAGGGVRWLHPHSHVAPAVIESLTAEEMDEVRSHEARYRPPGSAPIDVSGLTVVIVDDGIATGATERAAVEAARLLGAARVIVAAPVAPPAAVAMLGEVADRVDIVEIRRGFGAVGALYEDFEPVPDKIVLELLQG